MISSLRAWIDQRWPLSDLARLLLDEDIPGGSRFAYTLGSSIVIVVMLQAITGVAQLFFYAPTTDHAYDSISFLRTRVPFGWLLNGLHYWGGNAMVVLVSLHIGRVFVWGAYKKPRELTWLLGIGLLLTTMGLSFTGSPLPWDQRGYWAAEVGTSIPGTVPILGNLMKQIMRGGQEMGQLTLSRMFALHTMVLPPALLLLVAAHLISFRSSGTAGPWSEAERTATGRFWPDQVFKDTIVSMTVILVLVALAVFLPKPFAGGADPLDSTYLPKPEWNFLFLYEALKFFPGMLEPIGSLGVPGALVLLLVVLPLLDRKPERNPAHRVPLLIGALILTATLMGLSIAGYYSKPEGTSAQSTGIQSASADRQAVEKQEPETMFTLLGCLGCHRIANRGGDVGPDLTEEGRRGRSREWIIAQIRDPKSHNPGSMMPSFSTLSDPELSLLADYLLGTARTNVSPEKSESKPVAPQGSPRPEANDNRSEDAARIARKAAIQEVERETGAAAEIVGSAERGAILFERQCAPCHGSRGSGGIANQGSSSGRVPALNPISSRLFSGDPAVFASRIDRFLQHGSRPQGSAPQLAMPAFGDTSTLTEQQIANIEAYVLYLNGVDRGKIINPGVAPWLFFTVFVVAFVLVMLTLAGAWSRMQGVSTKSTEL